VETIGIALKKTRQSTLINLEFPFSIRIFPGNSDFFILETLYIGNLLPISSGLKGGERLDIIGLISSIFSIVMLNLILSCDNAAVIGLTVKNLPVEQRKNAALLGISAAIILQILFTSIATIIIKLPCIRLIGALLLMVITYNLLRQEKTDAETGAVTFIHFWQAVGNILLADLSMTFDNVVGVAGVADGSVFQVIFGLIISIPILAWGSTRLAAWMNRFPLLIYLGGAVLTYTACDMLFNGIAREYWPWIRFIPFGAATAVLAYGAVKLRSLRAKKRLAQKEF
jgi:YjbE family integral membrane protein